MTIATPFPSPETKTGVFIIVGVHSRKGVYINCMSTDSESWTAAARLHSDLSRVRVCLDTEDSFSFSAR